MSTGMSLRRWASRVCSAETMERLIDPALADLQHEYEQASGRGRTWQTRIALLRGYVAFWKLLTLSVPCLWMNRTVRELALAEHFAIVRALFAAALTMTLVSAALIAAPAAQYRRGGLTPWLLVLLLPQTFPFSLPLGLLVGVISALRGRTVTSQVRGLVVILGLTASLGSVATIVWVVPEANQAYRTIIARRVVLRGLAEAPPLELRGQALALRNEGRRNQAGQLLVAYHARWALAGAALVFAVFGLGIASLRPGRIATVTIAGAAFVLYVSYFDRLGEVRLSLFSDERLSVAVVWLPNVLMMLTSVAFLSAREDRRLTSDTAVT
jgi:lipopolysaccharide export system permease LptF/LptG-like protein